MTFNKNNTNQKLNNSKSSNAIKIVFILTMILGIIFVSVYGFFSNKVNAEAISKEVIYLKLNKIFNINEKNIDNISIQRISDEKKILKQDDFYKEAKTGDYIIEYKNSVILFDFNENFIKNIKSY